MTRWSRPAQPQHRQGPGLGLTLELLDLSRVAIDLKVGAGLDTVLVDGCTVEGSGSLLLCVVVSQARRLATSRDLWASG